MKTSHLLGLALIFTVPALAAPNYASAASDGALGATSTGSFTASLNINPPAGTQVQVFGLQDFVFPDVTGQITLTTAIPSMDKTFCISRSTPGNVLITLSEANSTSGFVMNNATLGVNRSVGVTIYEPGLTSGRGMTNGATVALAPSLSGCTTGSSNTIAHTIRLAPAAVPPQATAQYGPFVSHFTITVAPQ